MHPDWKRILWLAAWTFAGLFLIWLLFRWQSVPFADVMTTIGTVPWWILVAVTGLTFANKVVGMLKWRTAARYLADPTAADPGAMRLIELTTLGSVFGQVIPIQVSTLLVRWFLMDRDSRRSGYVVGATFFEQAFDLILLSGGTAAALAVLLLDLPAGAALATLLAVVLVTLVLLRPVLRALGHLVRALARLGLAADYLDRAEAGVFRAAAAPGSVILALSGYSLLRLVIVGLRAVVVIAWFAPSAAPWLIFVASPAIGLLTALPILPGGLGLAEWSWSAVLISNGAGASEAVIAALNLRIVAIIALTVLALALALARLWVTRRQRRKPA